MFCFVTPFLSSWPKRQISKTKQIGTSTGLITNNLKCKRISLQSKGKKCDRHILESHNPSIGSLQETPVRCKCTNRLKVKWQKRLLHKNCKQNKGWVAIKQLEKRHLKATIVAREKGIKCWYKGPVNEKYKTTGTSSAESTEFQKNAEATMNRIEGQK